ncbi:MAG: sigma-70 family RNA polymerase sigma factor [Hyphomonadaceae bacterium]
MSKSADTDESLARRATAGDRQAFAILVRAYGPKLAALARAYGVVPGDIEDVVQDTYISAWRALTDFDGARPFRAWLYQICMNKARDWRRRRKVRGFFFGAVDVQGPEASSLESGAAGPETLAYQKGLEQRVRAVIDQMPDDLRQPFLLTAFAELTYAETAAALGLSLKAVESRLVRARRILREKLPSLDEPG